jgi:hypothetical protein
MRNYSHALYIYYWLIENLWGLDSLFPSWFLFPRLSQSSFTHSFEVTTTFVMIMPFSSYMPLILNPKVPVYKPCLEDIVKLHFWGPSEDEGPKHCLSQDHISCSWTRLYLTHLPWSLDLWPLPSCLWFLENLSIAKLIFPYIFFESRFHFYSDPLRMGNYPQVEPIKLHYQLVG